MYIDLYGFTAPTVAPQERPFHFCVFQNLSCRTHSRRASSKVVSRGGSRREFILSPPPQSLQRARSGRFSPFMLTRRASRYIHVTSLPHDVLALVFKFTDAETLAKLALTSAQFSNLIAALWCTPKLDGGCWRRTAASGLIWTKIYSTPSVGRALNNDQLAKALETTEGIKPFRWACHLHYKLSEEQWNSFGITDLRMDQYILSGGRYYRPVRAVAPADSDSDSDDLWLVVGACAVRLHPDELVAWLKDASGDLDRHWIGDVFAPNQGSPPELIGYALTRTLRKSDWTLEALLNLADSCVVADHSFFHDHSRWKYEPLPLSFEAAADDEAGADGEADVEEKACTLVEEDVFSCYAHSGAALAKEFIQAGCFTGMEWLKRTVIGVSPDCYAMAVTLLCFHGDWEAHAQDCVTDRPYSVRAARQLGATVAAMEVDFRVVCAILADFIRAEKVGNWKPKWTRSFLRGWSRIANFPTEFTFEQRWRVCDLLGRSDSSTTIHVADTLMMIGLM